MSLSFHPSPSRFTLIEVLVALTILASAIGLSLIVSQTAINQVARAKKQWFRVHCLTQASEIYLTNGPQAPALDNYVFPYVNDCSISCHTVYPSNPPDLKYIEEKCESPARTLTGLSIEVNFFQDHSTEQLVVDKLVYTGQSQ